MDLGYKIQIIYLQRGFGDNQIPGPLAPLVPATNISGSQQYSKYTVQKSGIVLVVVVSVWTVTRCCAPRPSTRGLPDVDTVNGGRISR